MTAAQWQKVKEVTADAFELEPSRRPRFVADACRDDSSVCREVLRLIHEAGVAGEDFLADAPLTLHQVLRQHAPPDPSFPAGSLVAGRFEILQFLNRGGMGEVYAALDTELKERVALKTIRPAIASSTSVIERFKQEVRQTRRIAHRNVCRVYDLFSHSQPPADPVWFLTMELLEGVSLAELIAAGPIPLGGALPLIRDMAAALSAAHAVGIVHRDFKPNNVMIVPSEGGAERAVVTDFGLALDIANDTPDTACTPAYVAPEQAAGAGPSPAADQYSLGLVIAEMLTGKRPGRDGTSAAAAKAELESWFAHQPRAALQPRARAALERCLALRPEDRFQNLADLVSTLDGSLSRRRTKRWAAAALAAATLAAVIAVAERAESPDRVTGATRLTPDTDWSAAPSFSRDGTRIAYASNRAEPGNIDIWLDTVRGGAPRRLTINPAEDTDPTIAPDGQSVVFHSERAGGGLYVISAAGGAERLLAPAGRSPAFSPDGRLVAYWTGDPDESAPSGQLYVTSLTGPPRRIAADFAYARYPAWSPDGRFLVFEGCRNTTRPYPACTEFWIAPPDGSQIVDTGAMAALNAGGITLFPHQKTWFGNRIFFGGRRGAIDALWEIELSPRIMRIAGKPRQVTLGEAREREPSLAATGAIAFGRLTGALHIWRISRAAGADAVQTKITDDRAQDSCPAVSADGRWLFFTRKVRDVRDLFRRDLDSGAESMILASPADKLWPLPAAGGSTVAFESREADRFSIDLAGQSGSVRTLCAGCSHPTSWFAGERAIFYATSKGEIALLDASTGISRTVLSGPDGMVLADAVWSPANQHLLFTAGAAGNNRQVYSVAFPKSAASPRGPWLLLTPEPQAAERPQWGSDGKSFVYLSSRDRHLCLWGQDFTPGERTPRPSYVVMHYHDYPRFSPQRTSPVVRGLAVSGASIFLNIGEGTETIWTGQLRPPSLLSSLRELLLPK